MQALPFYIVGLDKAEMRDPFAVDSCFCIPHENSLQTEPPEAERKVFNLGSDQSLILM
jgi:hypothetical protein